MNDATNEVGAVWKRVGDEDRFLTAREGDMWCSPFQCDWCWFYNLQMREPIQENPQDQKLLSYIRRGNLDVMWSREPGTVKGNLAQIRKLIKLPREMGLSDFNIARGPWPVGDNMGLRLAVTMLRASQGKGRHDSEYVQYDTVRKLRAALSNAYESSAMAASQLGLLKGERGRSYRITSSPTDSKLFQMFMLGMESRMGRLVKSNVGIDVRILKDIIESYDRELGNTKIPWDRKRWILMSGCYFVICYVASLRGNEGLYLEGSALVEMINLGKTEKFDLQHVCLPLLGRFKTEVGEDKHVAVVSNETKSGIMVRRWVERLVWLLRKEDKHGRAGPAFCNEDGTMIRSYQLNGELHQALRLVQSHRPDLIPMGMDIEGSYGTFRSFRRGSLTRATEEGVNSSELDLVNRWRRFEHSIGSRPHMSMREHYLEVKLILKRLLVYSKAL